MKAVVFIGPSLALADAQAHCAASGVESIAWRAPARMGDVYRATLQGPDVILIIDGYFEQVPSVWHKEVLFALSQGVQVWGASSMGALRAAELHAFGMRGIGRIFEAYASAAINDDDEVAIVHGQGDGRFALASEAMKLKIVRVVKACKSISMTLEFGRAQVGSYKTITIGAVQ